MNFTIIQGDALTVLKTMEDQAVNCCITSPPYFGLRDYGTARWEGGAARNFIGIELNPEYVAMAERRLSQGVLIAVTA